MSDLTDAERAALKSLHGTRSYMQHERPNWGSTADALEVVFALIERQQRELDAAEPWLLLADVVMKLELMEPKTSDWGVSVERFPVQTATGPYFALIEHGMAEQIDARGDTPEAAIRALAARVKEVPS